MPYTLAQAREKVKTHVQASIDPVLTDGEVETILTDTAWASVWTAATAYTYGQRVVPTVRNGHVYVVTTPGTSAATEPAWPTTARSSVSDGSALVWCEAGVTTNNELYNIRLATYEAWSLKMAKAADYVNLSAGGQSLALQQVLDNLERNRRRWAPVGVV